MCSMKTRFLQGNSKNTNLSKFTPAMYLEYLMVELADIKKSLSDYLDNPDEAIMNSLTQKLDILVQEDLKHSGYKLNPILAKKIGEIYFVSVLCVLYNTRYDFEKYKYAQKFLSVSAELGYEDKHNLAGAIDDIIHIHDLVKESNKFAHNRYHKKRMSMPLREKVLRNISIESISSQHDALQEVLHSCLESYLNIVTTNSGGKRTGSPRISPH